MSSLEIAELTGKRHDNVISDIRRILKEAGISSPEFSGVYINQQGIKQPCFYLPYRETQLIISGYSVKHNSPLSTPIVSVLNQSRCLFIHQNLSTF